MSNIDNIMERIREQIKEDLFTLQNYFDAQFSVDYTSQDYEKIGRTLMDLRRNTKALDGIKESNEEDDEDPQLPF